MWEEKWNLHSTLMVVEKPERQVCLARSVRCTPESEMTMEAADLRFRCSGEVSHLCGEERTRPWLKVHSS